MLPLKLKSKVEEFAEKNDFMALYKRFEWRGDNWWKGFHSILKLELRVSGKEEIERTDILSILRWGGMRNLKISCPERVVIPDQGPAEDAEFLQQHIGGLGPTGITRILRFHSPETYGSLNPTLVRAFGRDGRGWMRLKALNHRSWYIPKTRGWVKEYARWIEILKHLSSILNENTPCRHPKLFVRYGLREDGIWFPADVEMALHAYAKLELGL